MNKKEITLEVLMSILGSKFWQKRSTELLIFKDFLESRIKTLEKQDIDKPVALNNLPPRVREIYLNFSVYIPEIIDELFLLFKKKEISKEALNKMKATLPEGFKDRICQNANILRKGVFELHKGRNMGHTLRKMICEIGGLQRISEHLFISYQELQELETPVQLKK